MRKISFTLALLTLALTSRGQGSNAPLENIGLLETFETLTDTLIKNEISMFNFTGTSLKDTKRSTLTEIPLRSCNGRTANFYKGSTFIHLYFKGDNKSRTNGTTSQLDSIFVVTHSHFWVKFPKAAFDGLSNIISCDVETSKKDLGIGSPFFKSFHSADKRRIYVYMIGGLDKERYEVTWVIRDGKFFTRTVDQI